MHKYIKKLKFFITGVLSWVLFRLFHSQGFDISQTILICGTTRSGSTWLAEIISSIDGHSQIFEPLNIKYVRSARNINLKKNMFITSEDNWPLGKCFFQKVFTGKVINPWIASQIPPKRVKQTKRLVVKLVRANLMLDWLCGNFNILPPALVIRHPCAVIASQLKKGWVPSLEVLLANKYFNNYPKIKKRCSILSFPEEFAALAWCLKYHAPLSSPKPYPFILICYENLVQNGATELAKLSSAWGFELTDKVLNQLNIPSTTAMQSSEVTKGNDPLSGWIKTLSEQQINNILNVILIFNIDFYDRAIEPDYHKMNNFRASL